MQYTAFHSGGVFGIGDTPEEALAIARRRQPDPVENFLLAPTRPEDAAVIVSRGLENFEPFFAPDVFLTGAD